MAVSNFKEVSYKPLFSEQGKLQRIHHCSGHRCDIDKVFGDNIDNNYQLKDNFNDAGSCFAVEPFPNIPRIVFFKEQPLRNVGPYASQRFVEKKAQQRFSACFEEVKKVGLSPGCSFLRQVSMRICAHH